MSTFLAWCRLFCSRPVVLRALKYAVAVGAILVPYCVSALSSVGTIRQMQHSPGS
jgi:hypothetical protein